MGRRTLSAVPVPKRILFFMLRFTVKTTDFGDSQNIGGPIITSLKTFTVECAEMEEHLKFWEDARDEANLKKKAIWWNRNLVGFEIVEGQS